MSKDSRTDVQRVQDRSRGTVTMENIRIVVPQAFEIPVFDEPEQPQDQPAQPPRQRRTVTAPPGAVIEINRTVRDTVIERSEEKAEAVQSVQQERVTEIESGGISWMLVAFFAGLAIAMALVLIVVLRFR